MSALNLEDWNCLIHKHAYSIHRMHKVRTRIVEHKKTGKHYIMLGVPVVINATNAQDGQEMVLYTDGVRTYVREYKEFTDKFEFINVEN